jgi:hypothetical protein
MAAPVNKLTNEQIEYFKSNRYVRNVGRHFVYFCDDFKEQFWRMYCEENLLPQEILLRLGVDYEMLGRKRVEGIVQNLKIKYADGIAEDKRKKRKTESDEMRQMSKLRAESRPHKLRCAASAWALADIRSAPLLVLYPREPTALGFARISPLRGGNAFLSPRNQAKLFRRRRGRTTERASFSPPREESET